MKRIHSLGLWSKLLVAGAVLGLASLAHAQITSPVAPRVVQDIDEHQLVTLPGSVSPLATAQNEGATAPDSLPLQKMTLVLKRSAAQEAELKELLDKQQNPKSPSFHKWVTPQEFGERFGVAQQDVQKTTGWLRSHGFEVDSVSPSRNLVTFSGTHGQFRNAFHTEIHAYTLNGAQYWANASAPKIPAALAPVISGFVSLNNFPRQPLHTNATPLRKDKSGEWVRAQSSGKEAPLFNTTLGGQQFFGVSPYDFATIYNVLPLWNEGIDGTGQTIAIVSNSDIDPSDVDYFRSVFGLPAAKLNRIYYGDNPGKTANEGEADLDVEWAGAVAKNATIDLVVASDTAMGSGIDFAAIYIVTNNLSSIMSVSYGACERGIEAAGNAFYNELWRQAAAQGITVMVAAGDAGSGGCDQGMSSAYFGLGVNGLASTPYTVAIGGTDLYGSFVAKDQYWNSGNDPATLASAKSYMPELPWNNTCTSPQILAALQNAGVSDDTAETLCNDPNEQGGFLSTVGAGGGRSSCAYSSGSGWIGSIACEGGYSKPDWQTGVPGIPDDGVRDLPDVSLMAGNGLWGAFYIFCQSDETSARQCDINTEIEGAGGTSFGSPAFAGIVALLQQKTGSRQGNINYVLYRLAASQYRDGTLACDSSTASGENSCKFYDVTQGTNSVPCYSFGSDCVVNDSANMYGILAGYDAAPGYDLATGLGTVNAFNLVNGWSEAAATFLPSTTTLIGSASTFSYGSPLDLTVSVTGASSDGTPTGDIGITSNIEIPNYQAIAGASLENGGATLHTEMLPGGTYQLAAHYTGDATFAPSDSTPLQLAVTPVATSSTLTKSREGLTAGETVTFFLKVAGIQNGFNPSGTATFKNVTTGQVLGEERFDPYASTDTTPMSVAYINISSSQLVTGDNSIIASYSGDANYATLSAGAVNVVYTPPYAVAITPAALTLEVSAATNTSATITVTPNVGAVNVASLNFSCPGNLPLGLTCSFSAPSAGPNGSYSSVLTIAMSASQAHTVRALAQNQPITPKRMPGWFWAGALSGLAGCVMAGATKRSKKGNVVMMLLVISTVSLMMACGGNNSGQSNLPPTPIATTVNLAASSLAPALNSPVTVTATVTPASGAGSPTGTVTFLDGTTTLATSNLASATATYSSSSLAVGVHPFTASYSGDSGYTTSTSSAVNVDVTFTSTIAVNVTDNSTGYSSSTNVGVTVK
jgi:hypothetical protein